jgi:hypothetical protein
VRRDTFRQLFDVEGTIPAQLLQRLYIREHRLSTASEARYPHRDAGKQDIQRKFAHQVEIPVGWLPVVAALARQSNIELRIFDWAHFRPRLSNDVSKRPPQPVLKGTVVCWF